MEETKRVFRWFSAWQDHKEELWLEAMAQQGWHLTHVAPLIYTFEAGEPQQVAYRLDYLQQRDLNEYLNFVREAGWSYVGRMSGWCYLRAPIVEGKQTELYTDSESKIAKYKRVITTLVALNPVWMVVLMGTMDRYPLWLAIVFVTFYLGIIALYSVSIIKLRGRIKELESL